MNAFLFTVVALMHSHYMLACVLRGCGVHVRSTIDPCMNSSCDACMHACVHGMHACTVAAMHACMHACTGCMQACVHVHHTVAACMKSSNMY